MARTRRSDYLRSNRALTLPIPDPSAAREAARRLLKTHDALSRRLIGVELLAILSRESGIPAPELVVPDEHQPHRRSGGRIVYSLQGEYRRRNPSPDDPTVARGGKPLGRIRVLNRTPARGDVVRPSAFLNTLLHEFCHHHDAEALGLWRSFHTAGFYARLRHLRDQVEDAATASLSSRGPAARPTRRAAAAATGPPPFLRRLWSIIRDL
ncbi:MAG TPA: hypothetical protein VFT43_08685 [Candidatus Polarisedimenticolia bacterium]|nr:hypothetical protein [Candidatus Polarisedimenticolia bacterium]